MRAGFDSHARRVTTCVTFMQQVVAPTASPRMTGQAAQHQAYARDLQAQVEAKKVRRSRDGAVCVGEAWP